MTANLVPVGQRYTGPACLYCHCRSTGIVSHHTQYTEAVERWDDPPPDCDCSCHAPWRAMHHRPVAEVAA